MSDARTFWNKHIVDWRASGETAKRYCERHGLSANTLAWWGSRLKRDTKTADVAMRWARVELTAPPQSREIVIRRRDVEIAVERGFDADTLSAILDVLDRRPS